jgi:2-C-methyl-D-erythritol 4-phosphate cytidylyltransferase/2-C-methyl-D-erythritol 2,4-cyclodiphosphate synthase
MKVGAVVPAAGSGTRFGSRESKLLVRIGGRTVLEWAVGALASHPAVAEIVVVAPPAALAETHRAVGGIRGVVAVVAGGATRAESVRAGLGELSNDIDVVLVHDAARPALSQGTVDAVLAGVARWGAAVPGVPVADTVKRVGPDGLVTDTVPRDALRTVQTPQGARRDWLERAYTSLDPAEGAPTDESALLERAGFAVAVVAGDPDNIKVTVPDDVGRLRRVLPERTDGARFVPPTVRTGIGYDVHPLAAGRSLWLGGVEIPCSHGLSGHSDADVVMHAVCDAVLGAAGEGDIGMLFPDTDEANRNRRSCEFVREAGRLVRDCGYEIANVDVSLQAEAPRIGPYRSRMRAAIAGALGLAEAQVGLKATTCEGMGYVGRREGMACMAVATLVVAARNCDADAQ